MKSHERMEYGEYNETVIQIKRVHNWVKTDWFRSRCVSSCLKEKLLFRCCIEVVESNYIAKTHFIPNDYMCIQ